MPLGLKPAQVLRVVSWFSRALVIVLTVGFFPLVIVVGATTGEAPPLERTFYWAILLIVVFFMSWSFFCAIAPRGSLAFVEGLGLPNARYFSVLPVYIAVAAYLGFLAAMGGLSLEFLYKLIVSSIRFFLDVVQGFFQDMTRTLPTRGH